MSAERQFRSAANVVEHRVQYEKKGKRRELSSFEVFRKYSSVDRLSFEKIAREMAGLIADRNPKEQGIDILDIGAGGGKSVTIFANHLATQLRQKGRVEQRVHFRWLDKDKEHVKSLREVARSLKVAFSAEVVQKKWENDESHRQYDFIILSHVIYYFNPKDYDALFSKMLKHLKPGGTLFIVVRTKDEDYGFIKAFYARVTKKPFNEATFEDAVAVIDRLNKGNLDVQKRFRSALIPFPIGISDFAVRKLIEFYMRTPWNKIDLPLKKEMIEYLKAPERDGKLRQTDGILIIKKKEPDTKKRVMLPKKNVTIYKRKS